MDRAGLVGGLLVLAVALGGCLGASNDDRALEDPSSGAETVELGATPGSEGDNRTPSSAENRTEEENATACEGVRENVTALLGTKEEDPFGDRGPLEPQLEACGDEGVFLLAAHGLEGEMGIELTWSFPQPASCETFEGVAARDGHHRFYVDGWDHAEAAPTVGFGTGGSGDDVFAGPVDSNELTSEEDGKGAWGGASEIDLAAGEHSYVAATNGWGAWENPLTEGAALLHILVCDGSFSFQGAQTASSLHLFSDHDMDQGAGMEGPRFMGASAGQALDIELGEDARLRGGAFAQAGAGAMRIADAETEAQHTFGPGESLRLVETIPEGPLTVTQARGGESVVTVGAVYGGLVPIGEEDIVGGSPR